jgi:hypothetical protein
MDATAEERMQTRAERQHKSSRARVRTREKEEKNIKNQRHNHKGKQKERVGERREFECREGSYQGGLRHVCVCECKNIDKTMLYENDGAAGRDQREVEERAIVGVI